jgi:hypothetical protein
VLRRLLARGEAAAARRALLQALSMTLPEEEEEALDGNADPKARRIQKRLRKKLKLRQRPSHACVMRTAHALEWLLFTALEAACEEGEGEGEGEGKEEEGKEEEENDENKTAPSPSPSPPSLRLLSEVASLLTHHPLVRDVVVSVARKTDASMWPRLFAAAGRPSLLASAAISDSSLDAAAACLLLVDRIKGADAAHALAIRLLAAVLAPAFVIVGGGKEGEDGGEEEKEQRKEEREKAVLISDAALFDRAELAAELLRFIIPPAPDGSLPLPAGWGRAASGSSEGGAAAAASSSSSSWWPAFLSSTADVIAPPPLASSSSSRSNQPPPPPPPGAPRGGAENAPAAEAAWCHFASAARALLSGGRLRALAALSEALRGAGGDLAALLAATTGTAVETEQQQSGASALKGISECLKAFPRSLQGSSSGRSPPASPQRPLLLPPTSEAGKQEQEQEEREREIELEKTRDCLSLACAAERADKALALALVLRDQEALAFITEAHPLLWADFWAATGTKGQQNGVRLPPKVAAAADEAAAGVDERRRSRGKK